jgi:D-alanyl-lipoteichoic acid acyltransferase DltB (MBOAT superfamily)
MSAFLTWACNTFWTRFGRQGRYLFFVAQLLILMIVIRQFQPVSDAFLRVVLIAFIGFMVHYFVPVKFRPPFFLFLSLLGIVIVFGLIASAWLIGLGLILIAICHLPVSFAIRITLLLIVGSGFALMRMNWIPVPWTSAIWPILGSMFMFRLIVYLYDIHHNNARPALWHTLSYFFMLPNVCFPLFPVIDYQKFQKNYYDIDEHKIYQVGIDWMVRGVIHLILYRVVYYYFTLSPSEVVSIGSLSQFLLATFLLYLKVSGQFHLIIGMIRLFGFNLPETNSRYLLASSFTDFWRRINIYWKDFVIKIFYYPIYFQLRRYGKVSSIILSTLLVFLITWILHSYQWFWLRGSFPIAWQDGIFWMALAIMVAANSLYEAYQGRTRSLKGAVWTVSKLYRRALSTAATCVTVIILWSLWSAESLSAWTSLWSVINPVKLFKSAAIPAVLMIGLVVSKQSRRKSAEEEVLIRRLSFRKTTAGTLASLIILGLVGLPQFYSKLGTKTANIVLSLRTDKLNRLDAVAFERSYYEGLVRVNQLNDELAEAYMKRPVKLLRVIDAGGLTRFADGFIQQELVSSMQSTTYFGKVTTNKWGMRDRDYEKTPAPNTYRIAILGSSVEMGWGVNDDEVFESLVENRLNTELPGNKIQKYEILNFGVPGYFPLQQAPALEKALAFSPNAILYMAHGNEFTRATRYLADVVHNGIDIPYEKLRAIADSAGANSGISKSEAERRLLPNKNYILTWLYEWITEECRKHEVVPILIFLPQTEGGDWEVETPGALRIAKEAGFKVIDLMNVFDGYEPRSIQLNEWDKHPNVLGHRIMAERIYQVLTKRPDIISSF